LIKSQGGERYGKGRAKILSGMRYGDERKRTAGDVSKSMYGDIKNGVAPLFHDESKGNLVTAWMVSGIKAA
jgi:hypothetical protein